MTPVVGTVLMVAIVLVLGVVVFAVANRSAENPPESTPMLVFIPQGQTLVLASIPPGVNMDWYEDVRVTGTCATHVQLKPASTGTAGPLPTAPGTMMSPGDVLGNCNQGETLLVSFIETETMMYRYTY